MTPARPPSARILADTPLYARADRTSPLVGTVAANECVKPEDYKILSAPQRGVVLEAHSPFEAGDVIYHLADVGEGFSTIWRRGEYLEAYESDMVVQWDDTSGPADPRGRQLDGAHARQRRARLGAGA
ncbi:MAG: hypothetical protein WDM79_12320 [Terricaulis sp.]